MVVNMSVYRFAACGLVTAVQFPWRYFAISPAVTQATSKRTLSRDGYGRVAEPDGATHNRPEGMDASASELASGTM
jgi:hypothetical protein